MYTVCGDLTTHHGHKVEECRKSWFERQFFIVALGTEIRVPLGGKIGALARDDSFSIHPRDRQARGRSRLVMSKGTSNIIPRALPVECNAYGVMLDSNSALIAHCNQWSHR